MLKRLNKKILLLLLSLFFLSACSQEINEKHQEYLTSKGWEIKNFLEKEEYILNMPDELLENYEASSIMFFRDYIGKSVSSYQYELKQTDTRGDSFKSYNN